MSCENAEFAVNSAWVGEKIECDSESSQIPTMGLNGMSGNDLADRRALEDRMVAKNQAINQVIIQLFWYQRKMQAEQFNQLVAFSVQHLQSSSVDASSLGEMIANKQRELASGSLVAEVPASVVAPSQDWWPTVMDVGPIKLHHNRILVMQEWRRKALQDLRDEPWMEDFDYNRPKNAEIAFILRKFETTWPTNPIESVQAIYAMQVAIASTNPKNTLRNIDGIYGPRMSKNIREFQTGNSIAAAKWKLDSSTIAALLTKVEKVAVA